MLTILSKRNFLFLLLLLFPFFIWGCDGTPPDTNYPPVITSNPITTATVNVPYTYDVNALDPDDDPLTYSLSIAPADMTIDPLSGLISWTPTLEASTSVRVSVTDGASWVTQDFDITFQLTPVLPVVNITQGTTYATIQAALDAANSGDTIRVNDGFYPESLTFPSGEAIIVQSVNSPASTHIEGLDGAFTIHCNGSPAGTQIIGFHITHAAGAEGCGIYHTNGSIVVSNCNIDHNNTTYSGGGIYNDKATMTLSGCNVTENLAAEAGAGIMNNQGTLTIEGATVIANNHADYDGGGIFNYHGTLTITDSTVSENTVKDVSENTAERGGGIANIEGTLTITGSTISENTADYGGGVSNWYGTLNIHDSIISENTANLGGGIANREATLTVKDSTISENSALVDGGGIYIYPEASPTAHLIGGCSFTDTIGYNYFTNNKLGNTLSPYQHIRSENYGDVRNFFPNNYYTP